MKENLKCWTLAFSLGMMTFALVACGIEQVDDVSSTTRPQISPSTSTSEVGQITTHQPAVDFPLDLGNAWVYSGTFYQGFDKASVLTATYTVTETVVDILHSAVSPSSVVQIARYEELASCPEEWQGRHENLCDGLASDEPTYYWYAVNGRTVYQMQRMDAYRLPERGIKALIFPLAEGERWYLNQKMAEAHPDHEVDAMLRKVEREGPRTVPAGDFESCFQMAEIVGGNKNVTWYCTGVGIVEQATDHSGTPFGNHEVLLEFKFPPH